MLVIFLGGWLLSALFVFGLLWRYKHRSCPIYVFLPTFFGWLFPFSSIFLLPIDITSARTAACQAASELLKDTPAECLESIAFVKPYILNWTWSSTYWLTFIATWTLIPFLQGYVISGEFAFLKKCQDSLKINFVFYGFASLFIVTLALYLLLGTAMNTWDAIVGVLMAAANAWGLLLVMSFLGHGLITVPRGLWQSADHKRELRKLEFKAPRIREELLDAESDLADLIAEVQTLPERTRHRPGLHPFVDELLNTAPIPPDDLISGSTSRPMLSTPVDMAELIMLNAKIKETVAHRDRCESIWTTLLARSYHLQDIINNATRMDRLWTSSLQTKASSSPSRLVRRIKWVWHVWMDKSWRYSLSTLCAIMSIILLWSEVTLMFTSVDLSIINRLVRWRHFGPQTIELVSVTIIIYLAICTYSSFMRLRLFSYYKLVSRHHTDEKSLLFFAAYFCRLAYPLSYNYLTLVEGLSSDRPFVTEFSKVMGAMNLFPLLGRYFNLYGPVLLLLSCTLVFLRWHGRVSVWLGITAYMVDDFAGDHEQLDEGKNLIMQARRMEERQVSRSLTNQYQHHNPSSLHTISKGRYALPACHDSVFNDLETQVASSSLIFEGNPWQAKECGDIEEWNGIDTHRADSSTHIFSP